MEERERRVGENEAVFREVNEQIRGLAGTHSELSIVCECGRLGCVEAITLPLEEYERVRSESTLFAVVPGHELADVEHVVEEHEGYSVIRKHEGSAAVVAEVTDPRE